MAAPTYSPHLNFNPDFAYGGRRWGAGDLDEFKSVLKKRKIPFERWARNHPTAARVFDPVEQYVYGSVAPQLSAIEYERQKAAAANQRRLHDFAGFTQAIMGMLGEISPAVQGAYNTGASTMRAAGTGYGDVLNTNLAANAAKGNSLLDVIGSNQRLSGGDAGGVLAGLAGWLPSEMMKGQGAGAATEFGALPQEASFQAQLQARELLAQDKQQQDDFGQEILGILQGLPAARAEIQDALSARAADAQKGRLDRLEADRDFWLQKQALAIQQGKMKLATQAEKRATTAQNRLNQESAGRDYEGNPMPGYTVDPKTGNLIPPGYRVDKNGNVVKTYKPDKPVKPGDEFTPTQKSAMIETIMGKEDDLKAAITKAVQTGEWRPSAGVSKERTALARKLFNQYSHLAGTPAAKKRLRNLIGRLLKEAGKIGPPAPGASTGAGSFWDDI